MLRMARTAHKRTGMENLCLAGGVALNCVGNGRLLREGRSSGCGFSQPPVMPAARSASPSSSIIAISSEPRTVVLAATR